mmetsp:Transcript_7321/g.15927  ORF Transcript_7321/g.15927 Transcript_7321/m.15927 type:complete len:120 (-) Transcript_7321:699-1058(-)
MVSGTKLSVQPGSKKAILECLQLVFAPSPSSLRFHVLDIARPVNDLLMPKMPYINWFMTMESMLYTWDRNWPVVVRNVKHSFLALPDTTSSLAPFSRRDLVLVIIDPIVRAAILNWPAY